MRFVHVNRVVIILLIHVVIFTLQNYANYVYRKHVLLLGRPGYTARVVEPRPKVEESYLVTK